MNVMMMARRKYILQLGTFY